MSALIGTGKPERIIMTNDTVVMRPVGRDKCEYPMIAPAYYKLNFVESLDKSYIVCVDKMKWSIDKCMTSIPSYTTGNITVRDGHENTHVLPVNSAVVVLEDNGGVVKIGCCEQGSSFTGYVSKSSVSSGKTILCYRYEGFYCDENVPEADLCYYEAYIKKYFPIEIWLMFIRMGWQLTITTTPLSKFPKVKDNTTIGLIFRDCKTIFVQAGRKNFAAAALHELGHFVYSEIMTNWERNEFERLYNKYMRHRKNPAGYTTHSRINADEYFAENYQRVHGGSALPIPEYVAEFFQRRHL